MRWDGVRKTGWLGGREGCGEIVAEEMIFVAEVEASVGEHGSGPAGVRELGDLPAVEFLDFLGVGIEDTEQACFPEDEEFLIGEDGGAAAENFGRGLIGGEFTMGAVGPVFGSIPADLSRGEFYASEVGIWFVAAGEGVEHALVEDGGSPVDFELEAAPDFFDGAAIGEDAEANGAGFVVGVGEEDEVILDDGGHGGDGGVLAGAEPEGEIGGPGFGVERDEALAGADEDVALSVDGGGERGGVAGLFFEAGIGAIPFDDAVAWPGGHGDTVPGFFADIFPSGFAGEGVEGDHAGIGLGADLDDEETVFEERRAPGAEEGFGDIEVGGGAAFPDFATGEEIEAEEDTFGAEGEAMSVGEDGGAAGAVIVAERVAVIGRVGVFPEGLAGLSVASLDDFLIGDAMMEDEDFSADAGGAEAFADRAFPEEGRAFGGEGGEEAAFGGDLVVGGAHELGPIFGEGEGMESEEEEGGEGSSGENVRGFGHHRVAISR